MSKIIFNQLYPKVKAEISKKQNTDILINHIKSFIDRNSEFLFATGPFERLFVNRDDYLLYFNTLNVTEEEIGSIIDNITFIKKEWKALNNPFAFLMLCVLKYFKTESKDTQRNVIFKQFLTMLALHYYAILHVRFFKFVQRETMEYTINELSNRNDLKIYKNVFNAIVKKVESFDRTYHHLLKSDDDKKLTDYIINLNTRISQWLKGILTEYIKNKDSGKYFNTDSESNNPEEYRETTNMSLDIMRITEKVTLAFFTNPVNLHICEMVGKMNGVASYSLHDTLNSIKKNTDKRVQEMVLLILTVFLVDEDRQEREILSKRFINTSLLLYNKSNTTNESVLRIKVILDEWLTEFNENYTRTERVATKVNFRKALFLYFVFIIQYFYRN